MHPCLNVDEILRFIAHELVESEANATAVSLACCRRCFEDPVLDMLWERQEQLIPLLKCLPQDVWNEEGGIFYFERIPTKAEWADFQKHARRMQNLKVGTTQDPVASDVLLALRRCTADKPFLPRLKTFYCREATKAFTPFIPLFLSPQTSDIYIVFVRDTSTVAVASTISKLLTLCPDLTCITLKDLPRNPVIVDAVSEMALACNRNILQYFLVDSPLTEEARAVVYQLQKLDWLWSVIQEPTSLSPVVLPNLTSIDLEFGDHLDWLQGFRGAMIEKLECTYFRCGSEKIGDFLEAFESVALTTSAPATLSEFAFITPSSWSPNYRSLLPFGQLRILMIEFSCDGGCSSRLDDGIIMDLAREMPKLEVLQLGRAPCETPGGVTVNGLTGLACCCPHLSKLRIHFDATSLVGAVTVAVTQSPSDDEAIVQRGNCALTDLEVGEIPVPEGLGSRVASVLLQIFPHIHDVMYVNQEWKVVAETIKDPRQVDTFARRSRDAIAMGQLSENV